MAREPASATTDADVRAYKQVLSHVLETRPSGSRQRLADALGKHRSFVTQITSPAYPTPIPPRHVPTILAVCHFSPLERDAFMAAYRQAHPGKLEIGEVTRSMRHLMLLVPDLGNHKQNAAFDEAVSEFIGKLAELMQPTGGAE